ncbi:MAG: outer membrane protein assembly factor BamA [Chthoniobacterales bacterium]
MICRLRFFILGFLLLLGVFYLSGGAHAQVAPQGPIVRDLSIEYVGAEAISRDRVLANLATQVGQPYSQTAAEQDIRTLYGTGLVENVRLFAEPYQDGVKVTVLLQGKPVVEEVLIQGTEQIKMNRVRREISQAVGDPLSEEKLEDGRQKILKLYLDRNFSDVQVEYVVQEIPNTNRVRVIYSITEGPKLVVRSVEFTGNDSIQSKDLIKAMKTRPKNILSFFNKSGRLLPEQVEADREGIRNVYQNRGFADIEVVSYDVRPLEDGKGVAIVIGVKEGQQYHVSDVKIEGAVAVSPDDLMQRLVMKQDDLYTPDGMTADLTMIRDFYGSQGYVDLVTIPEVYPASGGGVNITYRIDEGVQSYVNLVNIQGNTKTKDRVIRRELAVRPGDVYDTTLVDVSRSRLQNLNYFTRVETVAQDTLVPGRKDLNVIVEEKRTGSFNFGAGFSSIDSLVGFAELQQTNFDLFNWPRFVGGGQRFRIRGQYGIERADFVVAFTEPWLFGYKLSLGVEGYYREATYLSDVYDQRNYGVAFELRKPITRFLSASVEYRIEGVEIYDIDYKETDEAIQSQRGTYTKGTFSGTLSFDTRDSLFLTRRGELIEGSAFISDSALGGDVDDYGFRLEATKYFPLPWDFIFMLKGELAVVDGVDGGEVPIFDRLYLGGANNMRGFKFRDVGPKDSHGNPIGGNTMLYGTAELTFPIFSRIRGAVFTDWGVVNDESFDFGTGHFNGDIGIGLRVDLPIGPVRVDYGFPIATDDYNDGNGRFNINVGYQF